MSPPPSSGNVACLSCGHQGKSFGVLPWGSAFYSGEGWGRGYPVNVIIIQDMSNKETLQQLWKKQALYIFQPSCIYLCQVLFLRHHYDPLGGPPPPYEHIRIGTHSSGRTYNVPLGEDHLASLDIRVNGEGNHASTISICHW